ncbi:MAG: protein jag [Dehalococcoidia bacterium]|nr:protein jag [Dehalococcoidia bacterium]
MEELEITAETVEEATKEAEKQLGANRDQIETVVIREGKSGFFGIGSEEAVIKVKPLARPDKDVEVAIDVLETLLRLMGLVGGVETSRDEMRLILNIEGDDLGILIGRRGQTLACLQYIVRLIVAGRLKAWLPLNVDVCGYKKRRCDSLRELALRLAGQVKLRRRSVTLEPMPPAERRVIHLALTNHPDVITHSIGEGTSRKIVISLKRS